MRLVELFGRKNSGEIARNRLKLLLVSDRAGCSPELLEMIRNDFIHAISRYMDIDKDEFTICIMRSASEGYRGKVPALYASIPILDLKNKGSFTA
ncbi:MAG: cell division topological specificity factor MinE [Clostridium sp.]